MAARRPIPIGIREASCFASAACWSIRAVRRHRVCAKWPAWPGRACVDFALSRSGVFRAMFRPSVCNPARFPAVLEAGKRARTELDRLTRITHGCRATQAPANIRWAHVHGLACLLIDGPLAMSVETAHQTQCHSDEVADGFADVLLASGAEGIRMPDVTRRRA